jgi:hypothetical protein
MGYAPRWGGRTGRFLTGLARAPKGGDGPGEAVPGPGAGGPRPRRAPGAQGGESGDPFGHRGTHPRHPSIQPRRRAGGRAGAGSDAGGPSATRTRAAARSGRDFTKIGPRM